MGNRSVACTDHTPGIWCIPSIFKNFVMPRHYAGYAVTAGFTRPLLASELLCCCNSSDLCVCAI